MIVPKLDLERKMKLTFVGLGGLLSALGFAGAAQAGTPSLAASSFEDLLAPPPNAQALLAASDEALARNGDARLELVQDHHHHHHAFRFRRHHHHHHHVIIMRPHHHHHHHVIIRRFFRDY